ncbi:MAG: hypothetical protein AAFR64_11595 [Pseudomonadota bacterium]
MRRRSGGNMTGEIIYATIFMVCFVLLGGVVMYLSKTIDHGEARFDSETGEQIRQPGPKPIGEARPAQRMTDENTTEQTND